MKLKIIFSFFLFSVFLMLQWFREGYMFAGGETQILFHHIDYIFDHTKSTWWDIVGTGVPGTVYYPTRPFMYVFALIREFSSPMLAQALFFASSIFISLTSVYLISIKYFKKHKNREVIALVAAFFYVFNPYSMIHTWHRFLLPLIALQALLPACFFLYSQALDKRQIRYVFWLVLLLSFFSIVYVAPGSVLVISLPIMLYFLYDSFQNRNEKDKVLSNIYISLFSLIFWLALNIWWIIPFMSTSGSMLDNAGNLEDFMGSLIGISSYTSFWDTIRLFNRFYFTVEPGWGDYYSQWILFLTWIAPGLVLFGLIRSFKKNGLSIFFVLIVIALFLSKGASPPFGQEIYYFLFKNFPFTRIFRNPQEKMGVLLPFAYALYFGFGFTLLYNTKNIAKKILSLTLLTLYIFILVLPMWKGNAINFSVKEEALVKVPEYYDQADRFLQENAGDSRTLILPMMGHGIFHTWNRGYRGGEASRDLFKNIVLGRSISMHNLDILNMFNEEYKKDWFPNYLRLLNIKYILIRKDIDLKKGDRNQKILNDYTYFFDNSDYFVKIESFGKVHVYKLKDEFYLPKIYAQDTFLQVADNLQMLQSLAGSDYELYIDIQKSDKKNLEKLESVDDMAVAQLEYVRVSADEYRVKVKDSQKPFILVFSESYNLGWDAFIGKDELPQYFVNGFANGYLVKKSGDFEITVRYEGKELAKRGLLSLIPLLFMSFVMIIYQLYKEKRHEIS